MSASGSDPAVGDAEPEETLEPMMRARSPKLVPTEEPESDGDSTSVTSTPIIAHAWSTSSAADVSPPPPPPPS